MDGRVLILELFKDHIEPFTSNLFYLHLPSVIPLVCIYICIGMHMCVCIISKFIFVFIFIFMFIHVGRIVFWMFSNIACI
jgi:hypothetical protein